MVLLLRKLYLYFTKDPKGSIIFQGGGGVKLFPGWGGGPNASFFRIVSKYDQEIPQSQTADNPWHREEELLNHHKTPGRQIKQSNQLSLPHIRTCYFPGGGVVVRTPYPPLDPHMCNVIITGQYLSQSRF